MISLEKKLLLQDFHRVGTKPREIAEKVGLSIGTVYNYLKKGKNTNNQKGENKQISTKLIPFIEFINQRIKKDKLTIASKIFDEIKARGYEGSYPVVNAYVRSLNERTSLAKIKPSKHVETGPGEQAQVDWGYLGKVFVNGYKERLYIFVYVLSYSRHTYVELTTRQDLLTIQECHIHAFEEIGIPKSIRYDNIKTVILGRNKLSTGNYEYIWNPQFKHFAQYYNFKSEVCPPYWPRSKGKVEAKVKFIKNRFENTLLSKKYDDLSELNDVLHKWVVQTMQKHIHAITHTTTYELWEKERTYLKFPTNVARFQTTPLLDRRVYKDAVVCFNTNFYEIPKKYIFKKVFIREILKAGIRMIEIYYKDNIIATHVIDKERNKWASLQEEYQSINIDTVHSPQEKKISDLLVPQRDLSYYDL